MDIGRILRSYSKRIKLSLGMDEKYRDKYNLYIKQEKTPEEARREALWHANT